MLGSIFLPFLRNPNGVGGFFEKRKGEKKRIRRGYSKRFLRLQGESGGGKTELLQGGRGQKRGDCRGQQYMERTVFGPTNSHQRRGESNGRQRRTKEIVSKFQK